MTSPTNALRAIKLVHTAVWAFLASCVLAIPAFAWRANYRYAAVFIGIVFAEVLILLFSGWRCPLTPVAARYTDDRRDNFDIYLPEWLVHRPITLPEPGGRAVRGSASAGHSATRGRGGCRGRRDAA